MLWSSFHRHGGGVQLKPLSQVWEQRQHSEAAAKETGCNVMLAKDPDSCYDLKHDLFKVWPAPTVNNHTQRFQFQLLQGECVERRSEWSFTCKKTLLGQQSSAGGFSLNGGGTYLHGCRLAFSSVLSKPVRSGDLLSTLGYCCTEQFLGKINDALLSTCCSS